MQIGQNPSLALGGLSAQSKALFTKLTNCSQCFYDATQSGWIPTRMLNHTALFCIELWCSTNQCAHFPDLCNHNHWCNNPPFLKPAMTNQTLRTTVWELPELVTHIRFGCSFQITNISPCGDRIAMTTPVDAQLVSQSMQEWHVDDQISVMK